MAGAILLDSDRLMAEPGRSIAVPIEPSDLEVRNGQIVWTSGAESGKAPLMWVGPAPRSSVANQEYSRAEWWIGDPRPWKAWRANECPADADLGLWVAVIPSMPKGTGTIQFGGSVRGRAPGSGGGGGAQTRTVLIRQAAPSAAAFGGFLPKRETQSLVWGKDAVQAMRRSPVSRWRARLAWGEPLVASEAAPDAFGDDALEALAREQELRWSLVLSTVAAAEPVLAARLAQHLAGWVDFGGGVSLPCGVVDPIALQSLADQVISAGTIQGERRGKAVREAATTWLSALVPGGALVVDEAAAVDLKSGDVTPTVLACNFSDVSVAAWAAVGGMTAEPEITRLAPFQGEVLAVARAWGDRDNPPQQRASGAGGPPRGEGPMPVEVRVGEFSAARTATGRMIRVQPPGLALGPLLQDWRMAAFQSSAMDRSATTSLPLAGPDLALSGRLFREPDPRPPGGSGGGSGSGGGRWRVYIEWADPQRLQPPTPGARKPAGGVAAGDQDFGAGRGIGGEVAVYFGPANPGGTSRAAVRIRRGPDGKWTGEGPGVEISAVPAPAGSGQPGRVSAWINVPPQAIEGGKALRLGITRMDPDGRRSAWPRPMLPWESEPGRIAVDLGAWGPAER